MEHETKDDRARYVVDTRASEFTVQAFASGIISTVAHSPKIAIRDWTAETEFTPGALFETTLRVRIKATSLEVLDDMRDSDRREIQRVMNQEVLSTARFPEFSFESTKIAAEKRGDNLYAVNIQGRLSLHGVTDNHAFTAQVAFVSCLWRVPGDAT